MQQIESTDVVISGGGIAGMAAAVGFGAAGYKVVCVDPAPPVVNESDPGADTRTTAFLQPSVDLFTRIGLWDRLAPHAMPLQIMRIVDAGGAEPQARQRHDFDAADVSERPFGWNLPNWLLRRELIAAMAALPGVEFRPGVATAGLLTRASEVISSLSDGRRLRARLLVAADGRDSPSRDALGIGVQTWRYGQKALAFTARHERPHDGASTEVHRSGGPFTLVPLTARAGSHRSAVVWMERGAEIARLLALPGEAFEAEMTARSAGILGALTLESRITTFPIISQLADSFHGQRVALMAEAAHVVPPIGAQGLNLSMADLAALLDLATSLPLGSPAMLEAYTARRRPDVRLRLLGVDALNRAAMLTAQPLRDLRTGALGLFYGAAPVRKGLMRLGMGTR